MTSGQSKRPNGQMSTAPSTDPFASYAGMSNGRDGKASHPRSGASFSQTPVWQSSGIWGPTVHSKRNGSGPVGGSDDSFPSASALSGTAEVGSNIWARSGGSGNWNSAETQATRNPSGGGGTSPNRTRDMHDVSSSSFFNGHRSLVNPTNPFSSRALPTPAHDASSGPLKFNSTLETFADDSDNASSFPSFPSFEDPSTSSRRAASVTDRRGSQDPPWGLSAREQSMLASNPADSDQGLSSLNIYPRPMGTSGATTPGSAHSHRPSLQGLAAPFPSQTVNQRAFGFNGHMDDEEITTTIAQTQSLNLDDSADIVGNYQPAFQLNPGSQPWASADTQREGAVLGYHHHQAADTYGTGAGFASPFQQVKRSSLADTRRSTPSSTYHGVTSPKNAAPSISDPWSRPSSRDPRMGGQDAERRTQAPPSFVPHQSRQPPHLHAQQQSPSFFPTLYPGNPYHSQYPVYESYAPHSFAFHGFAGGYLVPPNAGIPVRPAKDDDAGKGHRSRVLEDFRAHGKSTKRYELKDIFDHVVEFSGDQFGSRFIQSKLETANSDDKERVFREIQPNAVQLMKDVFGNYVIQKFFEHGSQLQKKLLAAQMKGKVVDLSVQMYACRVVQKALEHVLSEQQAELVAELAPEVIRVVKDQNGNHVIQKVIETVARSHLDFVIDAFRGQAVRLATHTYGCRVIQRVLEHGTEEDKRGIMVELYPNIHDLICDQYGNYVIQHVIEKGSPTDRSYIINMVTADLLKLSKHKFASNVAERCIQHGTPEERHRIRAELWKPDPNGSSGFDNILPLIMLDGFANYVIQNLAKHVCLEDLESLVVEMKALHPELKKMANPRAMSNIDKLIREAEERLATMKSELASAASAPASPLQVDISSATPTPVLTMEPNTPQSSSPPSTNASAAEDILDGTSTVKVASTGGDSDKTVCPELRLADMEA